ncbi:cyclopropane-fatty-acyl-phospholipid synthase family protein [Nitratireductor sp. XY-223]|uniref:SAM-dependent methyltransferase n=1 Tax=Nitratireductor sp. XY-223 TaxID=2561926 RepID=UPI0010AA9E2D|nr:cyclopropane-fatty-acyl-phospholipid synthase family protein [Nitratireductor sp. XY-223]
MTGTTTNAADDGAVELVSASNVGEHLSGLPFKAQLALRAISRLRRGALDLKLPDGRQWRIEGPESGPRATAVLHNWNLPYAAFRRGTIGVAESYMDGDWESPDIPTFLELFLVNTDIGNHIASGAKGLASLMERLRHLFRANTKAQARKNIAAHYDLGNAFYEKWLDPSMTYSSALFQTGANDLHSGQKAKYKALADAIGITPDSHVLEIGCGWGGFAEYTAKEIGARVTGLTISREQLDYAQKRIHDAGLSDRVELKFQDYREERGVYDHIASIEMFEAVGEKYWTGYFSKLSECLKPGGRAGLQIITIHEDAFENYRRNPDFIQRYVFPGGMLPTFEILEELGRKANLKLSGHRAFAQDYARTLSEWCSRFWDAWPNIRPMGFDERFKRLWEFYLHYCEAGFRAENINVRQIIYQRG